MNGTLKRRENLRTHRLQKGFTQEQLAEAAGVSKETIKSLEYGRVNPSFSLMMKLCEILDCKAEELF
ncbi:helix-turn-helix transcriptional regulator [Brevibacillus centrosporus]|uniref:helix-turn-helix transcriptional regulator n=1 Tax=Brevibacillus centrosporus TaxID=54910 RepID=UPI003B018447